MVLRRVKRPVYQCHAVGQVLRFTCTTPQSVSTALKAFDPVMAKCDKDSVQQKVGAALQNPPATVPLAAKENPAAPSEKAPAKKRGRKPGQKRVTGSVVTEHPAENQVPLTQPPARKGRPKKIRPDLPPEKGGPSGDSTKITALNTGVDIFSFKCEDPQISLVTVPKERNVLEPKVKMRKVKKKRDLLDDFSETEEQVPLKITFKRPSDPKFGVKRGKSIKLRVKTQTTKDNGFKIQINQPKTKNPLKFKLKASGKLFKKRRASGSKPKVKPETVAAESGCSVTLVVPGTFADGIEGRLT
jgi:hypothetical protein